MDVAVSHGEDQHDHVRQMQHSQRLEHIVPGRGQDEQRGQRDRSSHAQEEEGR